MMLWFNYLREPNMQEGPFNTTNPFWRAVQSNLLFIGLVELVIYNGSLAIKYAVQASIDPFTPIVGEEYGFLYNANFWIIIPILITLLFMRLTCRDALKVFTEGSLARKLASLGKGLVLGFVWMSILVLATHLSGTITYHFNHFEWAVVPLIIPLFIQCAAEEMLLRGYVPAVMEGHRWDTICFVSGALFIFHHILNMEFWGFNRLFCLNVFLLGLLFCLLVTWEGNFWIVCGVHTAWNYTQTYLFGTVDADGATSHGIFMGVPITSNAFYDEVFGFEGAITTTVLVGALILFFIYVLYIRPAKHGDAKQA